MTALPPAGWFPDPQTGGTSWRWWDGAQWAPPGYGYAAYDPAAHARALAMHAESTRRVGQWFRWVMALFAASALLAGIGYGLWVHGIVHASDAANGQEHIPRSAFVGIALATPYAFLSWGYLGLFIAWLFQIGKFADLQPWPTIRSRTLGAFSPLIPIVNFWFPYEAIRDCCPPAERSPVALRWFILQLVLPFVALWGGVVALLLGNVVITAVAFALIAALLAVIPILGWRMIDDIEAVQRTHLPAS